MHLYCKGEAFSPEMMLRLPVLDGKKYYVQPNECRLEGNVLFLAADEDASIQLSETEIDGCTELDFLTIQVPSGVGVMFDPEETNVFDMMTMSLMTSQYDRHIMQHAADVAEGALGASVGGLVGDMATLIALITSLKRANSRY